MASTNLSCSTRATKASIVFLPGMLLTPLERLRRYCVSPIVPVAAILEVVGSLQPDAVRYLVPERAIANTDSNRPDFADALEMERRMPRINPEDLEVSIRRCAHIPRQRIVNAPGIGRMRE